MTDFFVNNGRVGYHSFDQVQSIGDQADKKGFDQHRHDSEQESRKPLEKRVKKLIAERFNRFLKRVEKELKLGSVSVIPAEKKIRTSLGYLEVNCCGKGPKIFASAQNKSEFCWSEENAKLFFRAEKSFKNKNS